MRATSAITGLLSLSGVHPFVLQMQQPQPASRKIVSFSAGAPPKPGSFNTTTLASGEPVIVIRDDDGRCRSTSLVCAHKGAPIEPYQLANGTIAGRCPYHGACFNLRSGGNIQGSAIDFGKLNLKTYDTTIDDESGEAFVEVPKDLVRQPKESVAFQDLPAVKPATPPAAFAALRETALSCMVEKSIIFKSKNGYTLKQFTDIVENFLDLLHINEVHAFGNPRSPIPDEINIQINGNHFQKHCVYHPGEKSLFTSLFKAPRMDLFIDVFLRSSSDCIVMVKKQHGNALFTVRAHIQQTDADTIEVNTSFKEELMYAFLTENLFYPLIALFADAKGSKVQADFAARITYQFLKTHFLQKGIEHIATQTLDEDRRIIELLHECKNTYLLGPNVNDVERFMLLVTQKIKSLRATEAAMSDD